MKRLSKSVILLGLVSLFADMASEMLYPVMPIYLKTIGFSIVLIGILEGIAEAIAGLSKGYFGKLSDNRRKSLTPSLKSTSLISKSIPYAGYSIGLSPHAIPSINRPLLNWSTEKAAFAKSIGCLKGKMIAAVPKAIVFVCAAIYPR